MSQPGRAKKEGGNRSTIAALLLYDLRKLYLATDSIARARS